MSGITRLRSTALALLLVVVALGSSASIASASRAIGTSGAATTATGVLSMTFSGLTVTCTIGLTTRTATTTTKIVNSTFATATSGSISNCNGGTILVLLLPTTLGYTAFTGTLPSITGIGVRNTSAFGLLLGGSVFGTGCLFGIAAGSLTGSFSGSPLSSFRFTATATTLTPLAPSGVCPASARFATGSMTLSPIVALTLVN